MQPSNVCLFIALLLCAATVVALDDPSPPIKPVPSSTTALLQLVGEKFQYYSNNFYFTDNTCATTLTQCGVYGTDLGVPVTFPDKIVFLFGDTWSYSKSSAGTFVWHPGWGKTDSIAFIDRPVDLSRCRAIESIDRQIAAGTRPPVSDYSASPKLKFFTKPEPIAGQPLFQETAIANLTPGQDVGPFEVPTGAFALNGKLYMFYNVQHQQSVDAAGKEATFFLNSILARSDQDYSKWKTNAPPTFTRLYDVSIHAPVSNVNAPPPEENAPGKFIHVAPVVMDHATLAARGWLPSLPPALQKADSVVFMWGTSWRYVHSNLYLAAVAASEIEATVNGTRDETKWWYCQSAGTAAQPPAWSHDEAAAQPLLNTWELPGAPCIGEHSVIWSKELQQYLLAYQDRYFKIKFRAASLPWGPWSTEMEVFTSVQPAAEKFIHHPNKDSITQNCVPVFKPDGTPFTVPDNQGATYGPYLLDQTTANADGSVTVYYTMSTWSPYNVFLMKTAFIRKR